jgi:hypothetical protein
MPNDAGFDDAFDAKSIERLDARQGLLSLMPILKEEPGVEQHPRASKTPAYGPCPQCGQAVLRARRDTGEAVVLDMGAPCYVLGHVHVDGAPRAVTSRAYVPHALLCPGGA